MSFEFEEIRESVFADDVEGVRDWITGGGRRDDFPAWWTPLADARSPDMVALLITWGADPLAELKGQEETAFHSHAHLAVLRAQIRGRGDAEARRDALAAVERSIDCLRLLVAAGADPNARTAKGQTPLIRALRSVIETTDFDCLEQAVSGLVRDCGADPNPRNPFGKVTAPEPQGKTRETMELLRKYGWRPDRFRCHRVSYNGAKAVPLTSLLERAGEEEAAGLPKVLATPGRDRIWLSADERGRVEGIIRRSGSVGVRLLPTGGRAGRT